MIDQQFCTHCGEKKDKVFTHMRKLKRMYADIYGRQWHGSRCPDCYVTYKKNYDAARRLKQGHTPIGTICICEKCGSQFELRQGRDSKLCESC